jgi:hypothetical protein
MTEARTAIGAAISAAVVRRFEEAHRAQQRVGYVPRQPRWCVGEFAAGHDASRVPTVGPTELRIHRDSPEPDVVFTWKVESGYPPYAILHVPPHWLRDVVRPGIAVLAGYPILQILDREPTGRPARILAMVVAGGYDAQMHGWRAGGRTAEKTVTWAPDGTPVLA